MSLLVRLLATLLLLPNLAAAHHSFVNFNRSQQRTLEGTVTRFEWKNPHVYIHLNVAVPGGATEQWQIESASPSILRTYDWDQNTLSAGDRLQVTFNPARREGHREGWLVQARRGDQILAGVNPNAPPRESSRVASSLHGIWVPRTTPSAQAKLRLDPGTLPLTPAGRESLSGFRESSAENPASRCVPPTAPVVMIIPEIKQIEVGPTTITIRGEGFDADRTVHLNVATHEGVAPRLQGHSIGRWEGRKLVVDTQRFTPNPVGNAIGVPSGAGKRLIETFELLPDGKRLRYTFELGDPEYLRESVSESLEYFYRPELRFRQDDCDAENSSRFTLGAD